MYRLIPACLLVALLSGSMIAAGPGETFVADVRVMNDTPDRLALALDRLGAGGVADGLLDEAVYFTSSDRLGLPRDVVHDLPVDLPAASVSIEDRGIEIVGTDAYGIEWTVSFSMQHGAEERVERNERRGRIALTFENGAALTRTERPLDLVDDAGDARAAQPLSIDAFERLSPSVTTVRRSDFFSPANDDSPSCQTGGRGSTGCSQSCDVEAGAGGSGGIVSLALNGSQGQSCVVQCGNGHYACCGCSVEVVGIGTISIPMVVSRCVCEEN